MDGQEDVARDEDEAEDGAREGVEVSHGGKIGLQGDAQLEVDPFNLCFFLSSTYFWQRFKTQEWRKTSDAQASNSKSLPLVLPMRRVANFPPPIGGYRGPRVGGNGEGDFRGESFARTKPLLHLIPNSNDNDPPYRES